MLASVDGRKFTRGENNHVYSFQSKRFTSKHLPRFIQPCKKSILLFLSSSYHQNCKYLFRLTGHIYIISIIKRSFHFHFSLRYSPQVQSSSCYNKCLHYEKTRGDHSCILAEELCFPGHSTRDFMNKKRPIICENSQKFSVG